MGAGVFGAFGAVRSQTPFCRKAGLWGRGVQDLRAWAILGQSAGVLGRA
jgi:hypothetical protein